MYASPPSKVLPIPVSVSLIRQPGWSRAGQLGLGETGNMMDAAGRQSSQGRLLGGPSVALLYVGTAVVLQHLRHRRD